MALTAPINVTAALLTVSVDLPTPDASVCIGVRQGGVAVPGLSLTDGVVMTGPIEATDAPVHWKGGRDLQGLVGQAVQLEIHMRAVAAVFTIAFVDK